MNNITLIGRLTRDIELKYTQSGKAVTNFTIAVDRKFQKDTTDFINCTAWTKTAENMANYVGKGSKIAVNGRLQVDNYEKDGQKRQAYKVMCNEVEFLDSKTSKSKEENINLDEFKEVDSDDSIPF